MDYITQREILRVNGEKGEKLQDFLAVEEPLEIRLAFELGGSWHQKSISVTMRTPGHDESLALGFLFTEGILHSTDQIVEVTSTTVRIKEARGNVVVVKLAEGQEINFKKLERHFYTTSSCGICGKSSIEAVRVQARFELTEGIPVFDSSVMMKLPQFLLDKQSIFESTGGLHAAALVDMQGNIIDVKEDVGRHNALDKLIGEAWKKGNIPLGTCAGLVSGRAGFELVQKLAVAGVPVMMAVGAPTSLAIQLAEETGMTLIGFLRNKSFNIYTCPERVRF